MAHTDEYLDCVNNWWGGFVGKETCEAGYLVCKGEECNRYTPEKKRKKQTNADKYFRNATDEELASFIAKAQADILRTVGRALNYPGDLVRDCDLEDAADDWLDWLKQEVE